MIQLVVLILLLVLVISSILYLHFIHEDPHDSPPVVPAEPFHFQVVHDHHFRMKLPTSRLRIHKNDGRR